MKVLSFKVNGAIHFEGKYFKYFFQCKQNVIVLKKIIEEIQKQGKMTFTP